MKRIYSLDFLKLVFAYVIAFFHFGNTIAPGPTVTVQIFFIISGFFLARKFYTKAQTDSGAQYTAWNYTLDHVKGLYPHYVFSYAVFFLYLTARAALNFLKAPAMDSFREILVSFYDQIPNLLFLQSSYYFHDNMNYPLWQLSALVIAGYFVYALLCHNEKLSRQILFPAAIFMSLSLLYGAGDLFVNKGVIYLPLIRAFYTLGLGVLTYYFTLTPYYGQLKAHKMLFNAGSLLALVTIFLFADHGNIFLITTPLLILGCWEESSWINTLLNRNVFRHCGKLSYAIYLNHALIARFTQAVLFPRLELGSTMENLLYFALLTLYSAFTMVLVDKWILHHREKNAVKGESAS